MKKGLLAKRAFQRLSELNVRYFTTAEFPRIARLDRLRAQGVLGTLVDRRAISRLYHGWYAVGGPAKAEALRNPLFLGTRILDPSYIGFDSAFHFYGWVDEAPRATFVVSPRQSHIRRLAGYQFRFVNLSNPMFFGYGTVRQGGLEFPVAHPEKAIVDAFHRPSYCGGIERVIAVTDKALGSLDLARLWTYARWTDVRSLSSRLGYVLETLGAEGSPSRPRTSGTWVKLDSRGSWRGRYSSRWHVIDNRRDA